MPTVINADFPFFVMRSNTGTIPPETVLYPADGSGVPVASYLLPAGKPPVFVYPVCNCKITYCSAFGGKGYTVAHSKAEVREKVARLIQQGCTDIRLSDADGNQLVLS